MCVSSFSYIPRGSTKTTSRPRKTGAARVEVELPVPLRELAALVIGRRVVSWACGQTCGVGVCEIGRIWSLPFVGCGLVIQYRQGEGVVMGQMVVFLFDKAIRSVSSLAFCWDIGRTKDTSNCCYGVQGDTKYEQKLNHLSFTLSLSHTHTHSLTHTCPPQPSFQSKVRSHIPCLC